MRYAKRLLAVLLAGLLLSGCGGKTKRRNRLWRIRRQETGSWSV